MQDRKIRWMCGKGVDENGYSKCLSVRLNRGNRLEIASKVRTAQRKGETVSTSGPIFSRKRGRTLNRFDLTWEPN
jgi:hypothetical protein